MRSSDRFRESMHRVARDVRRAVEAAAAEGDGVNVNVARRTNVVVKANVGKRGSRTAASVSQHAPVVQDGRES